ncbi:glycoside hydrolase family 19 protein [Vibrio olivae]|uniref:Glycoside hydrolase family 19 protein n=1 Tax=Vibrio olivae TaxID=1243002 RepID=A0ABV5HK34_9VIBR
MNAVFPILKRDGSDYASLTEFKQDLNKSTSGRYLLSAGHGWHGGVHINSQSFPWGKNLRAVQAMLPGKVAAYRISDDYVVTSYLGKEFKLSNNFVLLEHEFSDPTEGSTASFTFYTLYMHLAPPSAIGANAKPSRFKMEEPTGINVRTFRTSSGEPHADQLETKMALPSGTEFEYLDVDNDTYQSFTIGSVPHAMIRCKVLSVPSGNESLVGKEVWIASGAGLEEGTRFEFLDKAGYIQPVPQTEPEWMLAETIQRGGVVVAEKKPDSPQVDTRISVQAGEALGFLSLNEFSQDPNGTKQVEDVVHIEMFSLDTPPAYFLEQFENINTTPIDGTSSDGAIQPGNALFEQLVTLTSEEGDTSEAPTTTKDLITRLNGKRDKLENLIVQHQSEWFNESAESLLDMIKVVGKKSLDEILQSSFVSKQEYQDSQWHNKLESIYEEFFSQQQERAKLLTWMEDASDIITVVPKPYYFWPLLFSNSFKFTLSMMQQVWSVTTVDSKREFVQGIIDDLNENIKMYKLDTPERRTHFFAQVMQETGSNLRLDEYTTYSRTLLKTSKDFISARRKKYEDGTLYIDKHAQNGKDSQGRFIKSDGSLYTLEDRKIVMNCYYYGRIGNGNYDSNDGYNYRGRGMKQLTGRSNYQEFKNWLDEKWPDNNYNIMNDPDEITTNPELSVRSAIFFWLNKKNSDGEYLYDIADDHDLNTVNKITEVVNYHTSSYDARRKNFSNLWRIHVFN